MATKPTVSELRKAAEATDQEIDAAISAGRAELAPLAPEPTRSRRLDSRPCVETIRTNARAAEALTTDKPAWKRNIARTAILLAHPKKG